MMKSLEDFQYIVSTTIRLEDRRTRLVMLVSVAVLAVTCLALALVLGLHAGGVVSPLSGATQGGQVAAALKKGECLSTPCLDTAARLTASMDTTVDPCNNFYQYACGGWQQRHVIPPDRSDVTVLAVVTDRNDERLRELMESPIMRNTTLSTERKVKEFFASCLHDYGRMKEGGTVLLQGIQNELGGWYEADPDGWSTRNAFNLQDAMVAIMGHYDVDALVHPYVGYNWRTKSYLIKVRNKKKNI